MTPQEIEAEIIEDMRLLDDPESQCSFLIACGGKLTPMPDEYRIKENEIPECQVKTWLHAYISNGKTYFFADSESLLVKGILSFLEEIYYERNVAELVGYECTLLDSEAIKQYYNTDQIKGMRRAVKILGDLISKREGSS